MRRVETFEVDGIAIPDGRRDADPDVVKALAASMERVGLLSPILLREPAADGESAILISGRHRLEAAKSLGWDFIDCCFFHISDAEARMREITENLHRSDLTTLERAEQIEEWRVLCEEAARVQVAPSHPSERGLKKTARELNTTREEIRRAEKIAKITPEAKAAAKAAGLDNNQSKLLEIAKAPAEQQTAKVAQLQAVKDDYELYADWQRDMIRMWNKATPAWREWFLGYVDTPVMDRGQT